MSQLQSCCQTKTNRRIALSPRSGQEYNPAESRLQGQLSQEDAEKLPEKWKYSRASWKKISESEEEIHILNPVMGLMDMVQLLGSFILITVVCASVSVLNLTRLNIIDLSYSVACFQVDHWSFPSTYPPRLLIASPCHAATTSVPSSTIAPRHFPTSTRTRTPHQPRTRCAML